MATKFSMLTNGTLDYIFSILVFENFKTFKGFSVDSNLKYKHNITFRLVKLNHYLFVYLYKVDI